MPKLVKINGKISIQHTDDEQAAVDAKVSHASDIAATVGTVSLSQLADIVSNLLARVNELEKDVIIE
jgi:hypothetical protein